MTSSESLSFDSSPSAATKSRSQSANFLPSDSSSDTQTSNSADSQLPKPPDPTQNQFYKLLEKARNDAARSRGYSSFTFRKTVTDEIMRRCEGKIPYPWQLDISEALYLGLDSVLIAGTGAGKTLPFAMPLLADQDSKSRIIIVSTLNELERDQATRFQKMGIRAAAVNGESYSDEMHADLAAGRIRIIITSPEMILAHPQFSKLIRDPKWTENVLATVVDEAHCIIHWGNDFRKHFGEIEKIRSFMPLSRPILVASATLPPGLLDEVLNKLTFSRSNMFLLNLGNDRHNITPVIIRMEKTNDFQALEFLLDEARRGADLVRTIVYFGSRDLARRACLYLRRKSPKEYRDRIDFITAMRAKESKDRVMKRFREGEIHILCATEVAGMGMDISDIRRVVQFKVPKTLAEWMQHFGRAGRDGKPAIAILLVEPSVFQTMKGKPPDDKNDKPGTTKIKEEEVEASLPRSTRKRRKDDQAHDDQGADTRARQDSFLNADDTLVDASFLPEDEPADEDADEDVPAELEEVGEGLQHRKKLEKPMRDYIETTGCRRGITNTYFANPTNMKDPIVPCCDNCLANRGAGPYSALTEADIAVLTYLHRIKNRLDEDEDCNSCQDELPSREDGKSKPIKRWNERLKTVKDSLMDWRYQLWMRRYKHSRYGIESLLPKRTLNSLAAFVLATPDDIVKAHPDWPFARRHGQELLDCIKDAEDKHYQKQQEKAVENASKRVKTIVPQAVANAEYNAKRRNNRRIDKGLPILDADSGCQFEHYNPDTIDSEPSESLENISLLSTPPPPYSAVAPVSIVLTWTNPIVNLNTQF